jgi:hypothetical protein
MDHNPPLPPPQRKSTGPPPLPKIDLPSLSYFVPPPPVGWAVVGTFSTAEWHTARCILAKRDIMARIGESGDETGHIVQLLVPAGNEAYARSLLAAGVPTSAGMSQRPRGFPVTVAEQSRDEVDVPFATPIHQGLSPRQTLVYNLLLVFFWLILIVVAILTLWAIFSTTYY